MSSKRPQVLFFLIFSVDAISAILPPPPKVSDNKSFFMNKLFYAHAK